MANPEEARADTPERSWRGRSVSPKLKDADETIVKSAFLWTVCAVSLSAFLCPQNPGAAQPSWRTRRTNWFGRFPVRPDRAAYRRGPGGTEAPDSSVL
ncbi:hypothetical protein AAFF_G00150470 [Aldrovandia affinis]|uniref:Uncharacterized protein n=1 Tax=Aldrovandia affinis TaxID=143900 RepID=A0AAD7W8C9_9TELE|nr:hypothetical protein AAFF_G00150470 [Aldrovandia affinis]